MDHIIVALITAVGSGFASWLAIKTEIGWIKDTLKRHETYHEKHFQSEGVKYVKRV